MHKLRGANYINPSFVELVNKLRNDVVEMDCSVLDFLPNTGKEFHIFDVREKYEAEFGMIPRAIHLSRGVLERDIEKYITNKNAHIVAYCAIGARSILAAYTLQMMGFKNVYSLKGGYNEWLSYFHTKTKSISTLNTDTAYLASRAVAGCNNCSVKYLTKHNSATNYDKNKAN